jgi:hypothetical protein
LSHTNSFDGRSAISAAGDKILGSIREARAILRGEGADKLVVHVPLEFDVEALRRKVRPGECARI